MAVAEPERERINFDEVCLRVGGLGGDCGMRGGVGGRTVGMSSRSGPVVEFAMTRAEHKRPRTQWNRQSGRVSRCGY